MSEEIKKTAAWIKEQTADFRPEVGVILGTGLGDFAEQIEACHSIEYKSIPGFPVSTVEGHKGRLIFGMLEGHRVVAMQGRFHYYEGYTIKEIAKLLGLPAATVGTRLARGRERLRQLLKEDVS